MATRTIDPVDASGTPTGPDHPTTDAGRLRRRRPVTASLLGRVLVLLVATALTLGPVLWTVSTSLRPVTESLGATPSLVPTSLDLSSYRDVFVQVDMWMLVLNSVLVTAACAIGQMITAAMAGYVFAKIEFRGRGALFAIVLATMMVPMQVTIVPVFMLIRGMGLSDTLLALILPAIPTAFGTFLMRQYFLGLPDELGEAAEIDGAGPWRTFFSIYAPLAAPGLAIVGILAFNYHWNEFFRPLIMTISEENFTLPLGLVSLQGNMGTGSVATVLAGVVISMIPALVVFAFGQRTLREGLTAGSNR
ncbi:carbohydrate ABC transporter permease [Arsenicicoccus cauae]|uniref:carbohydrate ABC transporter permease n=1 Tax=Arsenicicoccus cauae TaxID=2663847 RepID=UPI00370D185F